MTWEANIKKWLEAIPLDKVRVALAVILVALIIYLLAGLTTLLLPKHQSSRQWQPPKAGSPRTAPVQSIGSLQQLHLFGKAEQARLVDIKPAEAPKTKLNVKLTGVAASRNPTQGAAVIESKGKQATYGSGDKIDGTRAVVKEIYPDRVMISNSGSLEALMLDEYGGATFKASTASPVDTVTQKKSTSSKNAPRTTRNKPNAELSEALEELQNASGMERLTKLAELIKFSPVRDDGQLKGWRLNPGKNGALFSSSGLEPGDLAIALNGTDLTDMTQATEALKEVQNLDGLNSLAVTVERQGQLHEFILELP